MIIISGDYPNNYKYKKHKFTATKCCCCGKEFKTEELIKYYSNGYCPACYKERIIDHGKKDWENFKKSGAIRKGYNPHI